MCWVQKVFLTKGPLLSLSLSSGLADSFQTIASDRIIINSRASKHVGDIQKNMDISTF